MQRAFRCLIPAVCLALSCLLTAQAPLHNLSNLRRWLVAIERHQPGSPDAAARTIGAWPDDELDQLSVDLTALVRLIVRSDRPLLPPSAVRFTTEEMRELTELADSQQSRGVNRLLKTGA